ncbi:hypothetical protein [Streptomyces decoyicus]|uniref:hypothetical protein n=1 Tax=Streptomyces decoyicus TaxID=249567 RepID=UPI0037F2E062
MGGFEGVLGVQGAFATGRFAFLVLAGEQLGSAVSASAVAEAMTALASGPS